MGRLAVREVGRVVAEHEERPARRQRVGGHAQGLRQLLVRELEVEDCDEIERVALRHVLEHVRDDPLDFDAAARGELLRLREGDVGEIDARRAPALLGQPDRVAPLAAGEIERAAGFEALDLRGEVAVRPRAPKKLGAGIARVPVLASEPLPHRRLRPLALGHRSLPEVSRRSAAASAISGTACSNPAARPSSAAAPRARNARRSPRRRPRPSTARAPGTTRAAPTSRPLRSA